jgi:hypothetical protein
MYLTKPAGVFLQLLAVPVGLVGFGLLGGGSIVGGLLVVALAGGLMYLGGQPARRQS